MSPKSRLRSFKARFKRILSDREGSKSHEVYDSASSSSSDKIKVFPPSRFKKKRSSSSNSSVNSKNKLPSLVRTDVSSSSSSSDNLKNSPSAVRRKSKKKSSSSSEFSSESQSIVPAKSIKKLQLIGLESRLNLPLHEASQVSPLSKVFASDSKPSFDKDRDQHGSRRALGSTLSPTTSAETSSPAMPRCSFSLNDSSAPSSPGRGERMKAFDELSASQSSHDPTNALLGKLDENSKVQSKISSPKAKRIRSAFLDEERGVWRCRNCEWIYPNPNPSARHRREHKKHCGEMLNVQQWLTVIGPEEQDVQGPVEEDYEEGHLREVPPSGAEVDTARVSFIQDQGETADKALLDSSRVAACEVMAVEEPVDQTESVREVDDGKSEPSGVVNVVEVNTTDNGDDTTESTPTESTPIGESVSKPYAESGEVDSRRLKIVDNTVVVKGFADNDAEGQGTEGGTTNLVHGIVDDVGVTDVQEQSSAEGTEAQKVLGNEAMIHANDRELVAVSDRSEALENRERHDDTQVDEADDASGSESPRHVGLELLHGEANGGMFMREANEVVKGDASQDEEVPTDVNNTSEDRPSESCGLVEGAERVFTHGEDESDMKLKEEVDFGSADSGAPHDAVVKGGDDFEIKDGMKENLSAIQTDSKITVLDSGDPSVSDVTVGNHENVSFTVSNGLKADHEIDTINQAQYEPLVDVGTGDSAGDKESLLINTSMEKDSASRSLLVGKRSISSSSSSALSSSSSPAFDDFDNDKSIPRETSQEMKPPVSGFQESRKGSTGSQVANLSLSVEETTSVPWRSCNAVQDEMQESMVEEASPPTAWRRHEDDVAGIGEGTQAVITPTITIETTWQSPPQTTITRISTSHEAGTVSSAIKKDLFKNRQTFWAEITRSDVLESSQKSPFSISSSSDHRTPTLEGSQKSPSSISSSSDQRTTALSDAIQSPSSGVPIYHSRQDRFDTEVAVTESTSVRTEASTSNFHVEASTSKIHPVSVASSSNPDSVDEYDLERVIHEQKTHDIMCPVCGSCITKRVILRKRKRYLSPDDQRKPKKSGLQPEPVCPVLEPAEPEGWGCLACFSIFFPKVRSGKQEPEDPKEGSSCLQIVFPAFPWGPKEGLTNQVVTAQIPRDNITAEPVTADPGHPSIPTADPPSPKDNGCFSYLRTFTSPSTSDSSAPALPAPDDSTVEPVERKPEPPLTRSLLGEKGVEPKGVSSSTDPEVFGKQPVLFEPDAEIDGGEPTELPPSLAPHVPDADPSIETSEGKQLTLPVKPPENDRCECFDIFLPVFHWRSPELKDGNGTLSSTSAPVPEVPQVIPVPVPEFQPDDRRCLPLFLFSKTSPEQHEKLDRVTPPQIPASLTVEPGLVQRPKTPDSPPPQKCLPFISSSLYRKPHEPKPTPNVVQQEPWKDFKPWEQTTTLGFYVKRFYDEGPPISRPKRTSPPKPSPGILPNPATSPEIGPCLVPELKPEPLRLSVNEEKDSCTKLVDRVLPTFPPGSSVQDPEGPITNCFGLVLPTFPWGPSVEEPLRHPAGNEEQPRPTTSPSPPEIKPDLKEPGEREEQTPPPEPPMGEQKGLVSVENRFLGHFVTEKVIVTDNQIQVIKDTTHFESFLDNENRIVTHQEIRDKPSQSAPSTSGAETDASRFSNFAQHIAEEVDILNRVPPPNQGTGQVHVDHGVSCSCLPFDLPRLSWSWDARPPGKERMSNLVSRPETVPRLRVPAVPSRRQHPFTEDSSLQEPLLQPEEIEPDPIMYRPAVSVDIRESTPLHVPDTREEGPEILKSVVYGGLDTTLISLGVVSSATGGGASTLTVMGIGLANVVFGFLTFLITISALYKTDVAKFKQAVGPSYRFNGLLAVFAYLLCGLVLPVTYGFSFRHKTNRDWKMGTTALVALVSIILLGWAKARVTAQKPYVVISTLVFTGFVAALGSYEVGDYVSWLLKDLGFDSV